MTARIVHRQDERGVIVESTIVLDDQEVPEGFSESTSYTKVADSRLPQGEPVLIEDSKVGTGGVRATGTIDETIEQEFVPEAAGEIAESDEGGDDEGPNPPPQGGAGSGIEAWRAYADELGVEVAESATRDDIVAAVRKAGHPV